jgi:hypothetical protein
MIAFTKSYKTSDDKVFGDIKHAQLHELELVIKKHPTFKLNGATGELPETVVAGILLDCKDVIMDILTTTANSKPKARVVNGGSKKRPSKTVITDANTSVQSITNAMTTPNSIPTTVV